jgi:hypothetical protein
MVEGKLVAVTTEVIGKKGMGYVEKFGNFMDKYGKKIKAIGNVIKDMYDCYVKIKE